jgi:RNA polymerase sigma-70 factor (ECF subfamily)
VDDGYEPSTLLDPAIEVERAEAAQGLRQALLQLPPDQRRAIDLAFFAGLTHEQIAKQLSVPLGTVKTRIRLGMTRLRDLLRDD